MTTEILIQDERIAGVVMVVDDDDMIRMMLKRYLESEKYVCFTAEGPVEAFIKLRILQKGNAPDLIVTDINMPCDGERLIDALAKDNQLCHIPILPMSGGVKTHISGKKIFPKPFDMLELRKEIDNLFQIRKKDLQQAAS